MRLDGLGLEGPRALEGHAVGVHLLLAGHDVALAVDPPAGEGPGAVDVAVGVVGADGGLARVLAVNRVGLVEDVGAGVGGQGRDLALADPLEGGLAPVVGDPVELFPLRLELQVTNGSAGKTECLRRTKLSTRWILHACQFTQLPASKRIAISHGLGGNAYSGALNLRYGIRFWVVAI